MDSDTNSYHNSDANLNANYYVNKLSDFDCNANPHSRPTNRCSNSDSHKYAFASNSDFDFYARAAYIDAYVYIHSYAY